MSKIFRSSFSKLPENRKFSYRPIYFDEEKEQMKEERELKMERGAFFKRNRNALITQEFGNEIGTFNKQRGFASNLMMYGILIAAGAVVYLLFKASNFYVMLVELAILLMLAVIFIFLNNRR